MSSSASVCTYIQREEEAGYIPNSNDKLDRRTIKYGERYNLCVVIIDAKM